MRSVPEYLVWLLLALRSPVGLAALGLLMLSGLAVFLFQPSRRRGLVLTLLPAALGAGLLGYAAAVVVQPAKPASMAGRLLVDKAEANQLLADVQVKRDSLSDEQAQALCQRARTLFRRVHDRRGEAAAQVGLGGVDLQAGRIDDARRDYLNAAALLEVETDVDGRAYVMWRLGRLEARQGENGDARIALLEARRLYRAVGNNRGEAQALIALGDLDLAAGMAEPAARHYAEAGAAATGDLLSEADVLRGLGDLALAKGRADAAAGQFTLALALYDRLMPRQQTIPVPPFRFAEFDAGRAAVLRGLGDAALVNGAKDAATKAFEEALALYRRLHNPNGEADMLRRLGSLDRSGDISRGGRISG